MANPWFRLYSEFADDPKVQSMPEVLQRRLLMLLCETCRDETVTMCDEDRAFHWRVSIDDLLETKAVFIRKGFCDDSWKATNWEKRQCHADNSKERTRKWRERNRRDDVTGGDGHSDGLEQNRTDKNRTEQINKRPPPTAVALPEWLPTPAWEAYVRYRKKCKSPFTDDAVKVTIGRLIKLRAEGQDITAVLEQSIQRGWTGVFEVKAEGGNANGNSGLQGPAIGRQQRTVAAYAAAAKSSGDYPAGRADAENHGLLPKPGTER